MSAERVAQKRARIFLVALMSATLLFIFMQSCLPQSASAAESEAVGGFIASIFPEGSAIGAFLQDNVRKIAHFLEHGLFGAELALYLFITGATLKRLAVFGLTIPFAVGFIDETIQIFSGRGPAVTDVWIDVAGAFTLGTLALVAAHIVRRATRKRCQENETLTEDET